MTISTNMEENNQERKKSKDYVHCGRVDKLNIFSLQKTNKALPGSRGRKISFILLQEISQELTCREYKDLNKNLKTRHWGKTLRWGNTLH